MSTENFDYETATPNQLARHDAKRQIITIASRLEDLATRIRATANQLDDETRPAASVIADVVNDYTQGTAGSAGATFWELVYNLNAMK